MDILLQTITPLDFWEGIQTGSPVVLAFVLVAVLMGWLVPGSAYKREVQRNEKLENTVLEQNKTIQAATEVFKSAVEELRKERESGRRTAR